MGGIGAESLKIPEIRSGSGFWRSTASLAAMRRIIAGDPGSCSSDVSGIFAGRSRAS